MRFFLGLLCFLCSACLVAQSEKSVNKALSHRLYAGFSVGYGSTTWDGLVPSDENQNLAINISTPVSVHEGGGVLGAFAGYEFSPCFALEGAYMRYPNANIFFSEDSLFAFDHDNRTDLNTNTEIYSLMAKFMLFIPKTQVRAYSSFGMAHVHRWDDMNVNNRITPTFGTGINYNVAEHIMAELAANYTAGYGESELNPAKDYVPFLYAIFVRLAYRI